MHFCAKCILKPFPSTKDTLIFFLAHRMSQGWQWSTIRGDLNAVVSAHKDRGLICNTFEYKTLQRVIRGIKRLLGVNKTNKMPITIPILTKFITILSHSDSYNSLVFRAAFCLATLLLRVSEFAWQDGNDPIKLLRLAYISYSKMNDNIEYIKIKIKASKTDMFRKGKKGPC